MPKGKRGFQRGHPNFNKNPAKRERAGNWKGGIWVGREKEYKLEWEREDKKKILKNIIKNLKNGEKKTGKNVLKLL